MKTLTDMVMLGDPRLHEAGEPVIEADLHNVLSEVRVLYHFGRGIAASQLGIIKRLVSWAKHT